MWWSACIVRACWGFFFFVVRCDELLDFPPSRLKVQHIPDCTGQYDFNLFSQAGNTDTILFGIPVPLHCQAFNVSLCWAIKGGSHFFFFFSSVCVFHTFSSSPKTSEPHTTHDIFQGHHTGGTLMVHIVFSQLKKQNVKKGQGDVRAGESQCWHCRGKIRAGVFVTVSQSAGLSVKDTP